MFRLYRPKPGMMRLCARPKIASEDCTRYASADEKLHLLGFQSLKVKRAPRSGLLLR